MTASPPQAGPARASESCHLPGPAVFTPVPLCTGRKGACCPVKTILCFGDSNTFGYVPGTGARYAREVRWPCRMAQLLGEGYEVVAEGLSGRTTVFSDYIEPYRAGIEHIVPIVQSHAPDALVVMLGTNDTKTRYHVCAQEIGYGMEEVLLRLRTAYPFSPVPKVVLVSPAPLRCEEGIEFSASSVEKSKQLAPIYAGIARRFGCSYFDAGQFAALGVDGIHFTEQDHAEMARRAAVAVQALF